MYNQTFLEVLPIFTPDTQCCCTACEVVRHVVSLFSGITYILKQIVEHKCSNK